MTVVSGHRFIVRELEVSVNALNVFREFDEMDARLQREVTCEGSSSQTLSEVDETLSHRLGV